jgi:hypothetical protein
MRFSASLLLLFGLSNSSLLQGVGASQNTTAVSGYRNVAYFADWVSAPISDFLFTRTDEFDNYNRAHIKITILKTYRASN